MRRRRFVFAAAASATLPVAGCLHEPETEEVDDEADDAEPEEEGLRTIPVMDDPPSRVYLPTHRDPMEMLGVYEAGDLRVAPMYTLPHRFWLVNGTRTEEVEPAADDTLHFMFTVWDHESGVVLSEDPGVSLEITKDDETVVDRNPWTMVSQTMGFHFGDNVPLDGPGTYDVEVEIGSVEGVRKLGDIDGRLQDAVSAELSFEVTQEGLRDLVDGVEYFPEDRWGAEEALPPMHHGDHDSHGDGGVSDVHSHGDGTNGGPEDGDHGDEHHQEDEEHHEDGDHDDEHHQEDHGHVEIPYSHAPEPNDLPGELLATPSSDDAVVAVSYVEGSSRFANDDYLLVSPRTPYNRCILPATNLSLEPEDHVVEDHGASLDPDAGFHYGFEVEALYDAEDVEVVVETPPQVSRHMGYETAFLEMDSVTVESPGSASTE